MAAASTSRTPSDATARAGVVRRGRTGTRRARGAAGTTAATATVVTGRRYTATAFPDHRRHVGRMADIVTVVELLLLLDNSSHDPHVLVLLLLLLLFRLLATRLQRLRGRSG